MLSPNAKTFSYGKNEKLKRRKLISQLFAEGKSVSSFPLRMVYLKIENDLTENQMGVSVSKRNFKRAVDRNYHKRMLREAYRLNKLLIQEFSGYAMMVIYQSPKSVGYHEIESRMRKVLEKFASSESLKTDE